MWHDRDNRIDKVFEAIFGKAERFPIECPVCGLACAHIYLHRHNGYHGGIWIWCNNCRAYSHLSGRVPVWWKNPPFIEPQKLMHDPDYLETFADAIDSWINGLEKDSFMAKPPKVNDTVQLKCAFDGLEAGMRGIVESCGNDEYEVEFIRTVEGGVSIKVLKVPAAALELVFPV